MSEDNQKLQDYSSLDRYSVPMPHMADDDLDVYEYRLYGHYKRVCAGAKGYCYESTRTTAEKTSMSHPMVIKTRRTLEDKGYIKTESNPGSTINVTITDIWPENVRRYAGHEVYTPRSQGLHKESTTTGNGHKPLSTIWMEEVKSTPSMMLIGELDDLEATHGYETVVDAIKEAVLSAGPAGFNGKYVMAILDRWKREGRNAPKPEPDPYAGKTVLR